MAATLEHTSACVCQCRSLRSSMTSTPCPLHTHPWILNRGVRSEGGSIFTCPREVRVARGAVVRSPLVKFSGIESPSPMHCTPWYHPSTGKTEKNRPECSRLVRVTVRENASEKGQTGEHCCRVGTPSTSSLLTSPGQQSLELTHEPSGLLSGHWGCVQAQNRSNRHRGELSGEPHQESQ